jgi:uncharacterized membrane protein YhaH (DUF805 family)
MLGVNMKEYVLMFKNALNFSGKSTRREYWMAVLVNVLVAFGLFVFALPFIKDIDLFLTVFTCVDSLYEIIIFIPMLSLMTRRLRDAGRSAFSLCWLFLPPFGWIILLCYLVMPSSFRVREWYAGYKDNPDEIKLDEQTAQPSDSQQTENGSKQNGLDSSAQYGSDVGEQTGTSNATYKTTQENLSSQKDFVAPENDSIEKVIDDLNALRASNQISKEEYEEILNSLTKNK